MLLLWPGTVCCNCYCLSKACTVSRGGASSDDTVALSTEGAKALPVDMLV